MLDLIRDVTDAYESNIVGAGRQAHLLVLASFLVTFGSIRTSTHLIRSQRFSWWPGNVQVGGTHIHHLVWGILLLLAVGYSGIVFEPDGPARDVLAILFGIGAGLTLDEFALWLNLEDVYWTQKGRSSIDAVVIAATLLALTLIGLDFWIDVLQAALAFGLGEELARRKEGAAMLIVVQAVGVLLAVVSLLKGKLLIAAFGAFVPAIAVVGAVRLAKPGSTWARRYGRAKAVRARARFPEPGPA